MKRIPFFLSLFAGFVIILVSVYGFSLLRQRPGLPPDIFKSLEKKIKEGELVQIQDVEIQNLKMELEFLLSQKAIGDHVTIILEDEGKSQERDVILVSSLWVFSVLLQVLSFSSCARKIEGFGPIIGRPLL